MRPDLRNEDLRGLALEKAYFTRADLRHTNFADADLRHAKFFFADLRGASLDRVNREGAKFGKANMRECSLVEANLNNANMNRANLFKANLQRARLSRTNLFRACLTQADLSGASLLSTDLTSAHLDEANLSGVRMGSAKLANLNLSRTLGLDLVRHQALSHLTIETITRSKGAVTTSFLRGCGAPEDFIAFAAARAEVVVEYCSCFISYAHADKAFAQLLHDSLQGHGIRCWLDEHQILPGDDIFDQVDRGIRLWDKVLLCCSEASLSSWWVDNEIMTAFNKERQLQTTRGKKVLALVPLNLDGYLFSDQWQRGYKKQIISRLAADFTSWRTDKAKFSLQLDRLMRALRVDSAGRESPPEPLV